MSSSTNLLTYAVVIVQHINKFWTGWGGGEGVRTIDFINISELVTVFNLND